MSLPLPSSLASAYVASLTEHSRVVSQNSSLSSSPSLSTATSSDELTCSDKDSSDSESEFSFDEATVETEFGHCSDDRYRYTSQYISGTDVEIVEKEPPLYIFFAAALGCRIIFMLGYVRDFFGKLFMPLEFSDLKETNGYAPLNGGIESFVTRRYARRLVDNHYFPVSGVAGRTIVTYDRYSPDWNGTQILTGGTTRSLNTASYNYLGFAQTKGGVADVVEECLRRYGVSTCGSRLEGGSNELHAMAESLVSRFVGMEDAIICSMGFATNSTILPSLVGKGCLVISDEFNHASIRFGVRLSGAHVRSFKHNNMRSLEKVLKDAIAQGQPKTHRAWKKILLVVEGLYSMEGTLVNLPKVVELKKKYKFYLFVDEAHSIGALGPHGRGVADFFSIHPRSIDILMGTFTKSFGAAGGYVAGDHALINSLRLCGHSGPYAEAMSPPVLMQVVASMASIMGVHPGSVPRMRSASSDNRVRSSAPGADHPGPIPRSALPHWVTLPSPLASGSEGQARIRRLAFNARYLHKGLDKLGFITYGHPASPIVPLVLFTPGKISLFRRMMKDRQNSIVVVAIGFPATSMFKSRVRFCVSAAHTKEDIDEVLRACDEIGDVLDLKHGCRRGERWSLQDIIDRSVELVNSDS